MRIILNKYYNADFSSRAIRVALVVGTILNLINHYDIFFGQHFGMKELFQMSLTYFIPYIVYYHGQLISSL